MSKIKFKPREVGTITLLPTGVPILRKTVDDNTLKVAEKLSRHLKLIEEYKDRLDAVNYLIDSAAKLSGNPSFAINDSEVEQAVGRLSDQKNVDFDLFKTCVDIVISEWKKIVVYSVTDILDPNVAEKAESGE